MSFLRKFKNRLVGFNYLVFSEKIENLEKLEIDYLVRTMFSFYGKYSVNWVA